MDVIFVPSPILRKKSPQNRRRSELIPLILSRNNPEGRRGEVDEVARREKRERERKGGGGGKKKKRKEKISTEVGLSWHT